MRECTDFYTDSSRKKTTVTKQWQANHMYGMSHGLQPSSKLESNCESAHRPGPQLWCQQCFSSSHSYMENQDMSQRCMCDSGCSVSAPTVRRGSWCIVTDSLQTQLGEHASLQRNIVSGHKAQHQLLWSSRSEAELACSMPSHHRKSDWGGSLFVMSRITRSVLQCPQTLSSAFPKETRIKQSMHQAC